MTARPSLWCVRAMLPLAAMLTLGTGVLPASAAGVDVRVNVANPPAPFPTDKSAEAAIAINPDQPDMVAAGAFDEVDEAPCGTAQSSATRPCPFVTGVGTSGVYFSYDRGHTWVQPTYTGWTAATGTAMPGPIHTLPGYFEAGLQSDADSAVAFGPTPVSYTHLTLPTKA